MALYTFCGAALYTFCGAEESLFYFFFDFALAERATENGSKIRFRKRISL
jgi:hypothetical protein